ncbi:TetR/AcrR family transcriptional regulator [Reyranella sp. CPCC 100927]|uniref:TetR/AcrR family transcriptional regulator n=1 Tax=Reyranella sp. CPCC 100927 TaxID=2599616 RepID=UPI001C4989A7|nr:TetR/AcrR family transcriptional regulator [Reyranella sp. CPCC 100927]
MADQGRDLDWDAVMPRPRRRYPLRRSSEERREQILTAAILLFGRDGFHRTTVQDVADEAKISAGLIYQYFRDKEDLLFAAIGEIFDVYKREIPLAVQQHTEPFAQFKAAIQTYCRVVDEHRGAALLGYRESRSLSRAKIKTTMKKELQSTSLIAGCVERCVTAKIFRPINVDVLTYHLVVLAHSWALNAWRLPRLTREQYVEDCLEIILKPVLAD